MGAVSLQSCGAHRVRGFPCHPQALQELGIASQMGKSKISGGERPLSPCLGHPRSLTKAPTSSSGARKTKTIPCSCCAILPTCHPLLPTQTQLGSFHLLRSCGVSVGQPQTFSFHEDSRSYPGRSPQDCPAMDGAVAVLSQ